MTTKYRWALTPLIVATSLLVLTTPSARAQERTEELGEVTIEKVTTEEEFEDIEEILEEDELDFAGQGITYDPGDRRDPFRSLLSTDRSGTRPTGPRPEGISGLMITEIEITGVFVTPDGPVAQIQTADSTKSFLLRAGDQLFDGDVVSISRNEVVFKQIINDPTALKPFREVVKKLNL